MVTKGTIQYAQKCPFSTPIFLAYIIRVTNEDAAATDHRQSDKQFQGIVARVKKEVIDIYILLKDV